MALVVAFVVAMIAITAVAAFGGPTGEFRRLRRSGSRVRLPGRRFRLLRKAADPLDALAAVPPLGLEIAPPVVAPSGAADAESVLVGLLLSGRLSQADYQQQMATLAAAESARGALP